MQTLGSKFDPGNAFLCSGVCWIGGSQAWIPGAVVCGGYVESGPGSLVWWKGRIWAWISEVLVCAE